MKARVILQFIANRISPLEGERGGLWIEREREREREREIGAKQRSEHFAWKEKPANSDSNKMIERLNTLLINNDNVSVSLFLTNFYIHEMQ